MSKSIPPSGSNHTAFLTTPTGSRKENDGDNNKARVDQMRTKINPFFPFKRSASRTNLKSKSPSSSPKSVEKRNASPQVANPNLSSLPDTIGEFLNFFSKNNFFSGRLVLDIKCTNTPSTPRGAVVLQEESVEIPLSFDNQEPLDWLMTTLEQKSLAPSYTVIAELKSFGESFTPKVKEACFQRLARFKQVESVSWASFRISEKPSDLNTDEEKVADTFFAWLLVHQNRYIGMQISPEEIFASFQKELIQQKLEEKVPFLCQLFRVSHFSGSSKQMIEQTFRQKTNQPTLFVRHAQTKEEPRRFLIEIIDTQVKITYKERLIIAAGVIGSETPYAGLTLSFNQKSEPTVSDFNIHFNVQEPMKTTLSKTFESLKK